jgi:hypothetical protein
MFNIRSNADTYIIFFFSLTYKYFWMKYNVKKNQGGIQY